MRHVIQVTETIARESLIFPNQGVAIRIAVGIGGNLDQVYQRPHSTATASEKLNNADCGMSGIESMNSESSCKYAKQQGGEPILGIVLTHGLIVIEAYTAIWANKCLGRCFLATV